MGTAAVHMMMNPPCIKHSILIQLQYDHTGMPVQGGRVLFVRLPRDYTSRQQPGVNEIAFAFQCFGTIADVSQVDNKGGFVVVLGGELAAAVHAASAIITTF